MPREFRVRWQREGRAPRTQIFQRETRARDKVDRLLVIDVLKDDDPQYHGMPDLVGTPQLQSREVGEWEDEPEQPDPRPCRAAADELVAVSRARSDAPNAARGEWSTRQVADDDIPF